MGAWKRLIEQQEEQETEKTIEQLAYEKMLLDEIEEEIEATVWEHS